VVLNSIDLEFAIAELYRGLDEWGDRTWVILPNPVQQPPDSFL
jgi:hypothetical protein